MPLTNELTASVLDVDTAATLLQLADRHNARQLKSCALEFIVQNFAAVSKTPAFAELDRDLLTYITMESVRRLQSAAASQPPK